MTHEVNRGIGYTVERSARGEIKVLLPYLDPQDVSIRKFRAPSVSFPSNAAPNGKTFDEMRDDEIVSWVRDNIAG